MLLCYLVFIFTASIVSKFVPNFKNEMATVHQHDKKKRSQINHHCGVERFKDYVKNQRATEHQYDRKNDK